MKDKALRILPGLPGALAVLVWGQQIGFLTVLAFMTGLAMLWLVLELLYPLTQALADYGVRKIDGWGRAALGEESTGEWKKSLRPWR